MDKIQKIKWCIIFFMLLGLGQLIYAQQQTVMIKGMIVDENNEPIIGATILEKGTNNGTISDYNGNFTLNVNPGSTVQISYVGYDNLEFNANSIPEIIIMKESSLALSEVVVTGYTTQRKADLTGAVAVVKVDQLKSSPTGNSMRALQGKVPGMRINLSGSPDPWSTVRIRGEGTLNNNDPLYIIDGTPTTRSMSELASMDIESIQVLKDASSASIYGARAANGVIIITTRKGKKGKLTVDFNTSHTLVSSAKPYDLMNTKQRGIAQFWAIVNDNPNADPNEVGIAQLYQYKYHKDEEGYFVLDDVTWREWLDPETKTMRSADTDWQKEVLRTGYVQQYNVTLSSGSDRGSALFALDYYDNKGTVKEDLFRRINARINSDYSWLDNRVKIGENFTVSQWRSMPNIGDGILGACRSIMSIVPVHTEDGGWGGPIGGMSDRQNPVRLIEDNRQNHDDHLRLFGNAFLNIQLMKGLTFNSNFGLDLVGYWRRNMDLRYKSGFLSEDKNKVTNWANYTFSWNNSNVLQYVFNIGKNNFDIMGGQETISNDYNDIWASRRVFALETTDYMYLNAGEQEKDNGGGAAMNRMISWFGKMNYNYDNRYLASFTLRRDASSVFGENNRWATFPAFSVGWVLSSEKFLENFLSGFSHLKLRYGWGQNGNSQIDNYAHFQMYEYLYDSNDVWDWNWGTAYDITGQAGTLPAGFRRIQRGNPNLKWESTLQHNFGLDFVILDSRLTGSFDYYLKYTRDILMKPGYVATLGEGAGMWLNGADIDNKGFEINLDYNQKIKDVHFNIGGILSHNQNTIVKVPEQVINNFPGDGMEDNILGRSRYSLYGYVADGLFQSQEEVENHATQVGAAPGRIRYKDLNGDKTIDSKDRTWIGDENPDFEFGVTMGLEWNNFDFSLFLNGILGKDLNVSGWKSWTDFYFLGTVGENYGTRLLNAWTPKNNKSTIPALSINNYNDEGRFSTYFVESGSFIKIKNMELGYTLPDNLANSLKIQHSRIFLRADNVLTVKKTWGDDAYTGLDPETPGNTYPLPFSMTMGLNITF
jgi:TonB-linked SusC/RagA family outer membrane protein